MTFNTDLITDNHIVNGIEPYFDDDDAKGSSSSGQSAGGAPNNTGRLRNPGAPALVPNGVGGSDNDAVMSMLVDYNDKFAGSTGALYRDRVINSMISALVSKKKANALLVGEAGVGKTGVVEELARRIADGHESIPAALADKTIYELPLSSLVAGAGIVGMLEDRVKQLITFATDPDNNAILFIDEIHMLAGEQQDTYSKITQILKPALARGDISVIGATTSQESRSLSDDPAFKRRFTTVAVAELTRGQTADIVAHVAQSYLDHYNHRVTFDTDLAGELVRVADERTDKNLHRPDNALTLLDRALARKAVEVETLINKGIAASYYTRPLTINDIAKTADQITTSDAEVVTPDYTALSDNLSRLINQQVPTTQVLTAVRRRMMNLRSNDRPLTFLLPGPSGVGKTETARILAHGLTGEAPIRIDMAEYADKMSMTKLIGSSAGYVGSSSNRPLPLDPLRMNPRRVLVLDELEKADRSVQQLFLSAFENGTITMARGDNLDLRSTIIIATTNAASEEIRKSAGFGFNDSATGGTMTMNIAQRTRITAALEKHFRPELLSRFSQIIPFNGLDVNDFATVIIDTYETMAAEILDGSPSLATKLPVQLDKDSAMTLAKASFVPALGARPAHTVVENLINDIIDPVGAVPDSPTAVIADDLAPAQKVNDISFN